MDISRDQLKEALGFMHEARKLLFQMLHERTDITRDLVEGVDRLGLAFEFAENPHKLVCLCPACECHFYEVGEGGRMKCLICDTEWGNLQQPEAADGERH